MITKTFHRALTTTSDIEQWLRDEGGIPINITTDAYETSWKMHNRVMRGIEQSGKAVRVILSPNGEIEVSVTEERIASAR